MGAEPEFLQPIKGALDWGRKFWNESLGMGNVAPVAPSSRARLSVPFIDYARGDGMKIGAGCEETWDPEMISDEIGWVQNYRGLWGLDTHDPIGGERAPAGPKYNRDGSVRQSWHDPIGWAGLGKVLPPAKLPREIGARLVSLQTELSELDREIEKGRGALRRQAMDVEALEVTEYFSGLQKKKESELQEIQNSVEALLAHQAELIQTQQALESFARRVELGDLGPPTRHLRQVQHPEPPLGRQYRLVEIWAALSGAVILLVIVGLLISRPAYLLLWLLGLGVGLRGLEALTRGELINYLLSITIFLAVIGAIILIVEFWFWALILVLVGIVIFMICGNLLELRQ